MDRADQPADGQSRATFRVFVASGYGITALEVAGDSVVNYALVQECTGRDLAVVGTGVAVATSTDVLLGDEEAFEPTDFGPAVAVGGDPLLAADPAGRVFRRLENEWDPVGTLDTRINAIDGDLIATDDGVFRLTDGGFQHVGLERVTDVATPGVPHAATEDGLYKLGAGWMKELDGAFTLVTADPLTASGGVLERAHAATADRLFVYEAGEWHDWHIPVDAPVTGIGYGEVVYAVAENGTFLAVEGDAWRTRALGLSDVADLVVLGDPEENA